MPRVNRKKSLDSNEQVSGGLYIVEDVVDYRLVDGQEQYLVLWKGYSKQEATWEPVQNIKSFEDDGWDQTFEICKRKAWNRMIRASKTKQITPANRSDRPYRRNSEEYKKLIHSRCSKLADLLAKQFPKIINQFGISDTNEVMKTEEFPTLIDEGMDIEGEELPQKSMSGCSSETEKEIKHEVICPQIQRKSQSESNSYKQQFDDETMVPLFDDLKVTGIREKVMIGKRVFYEIECSNLDPSQPVMLAQRYVKLFLTEHLNKFNEKCPMEIDL